MALLNLVFQGDCIHEMNNCIPEKSVDMIFCRSSLQSPIRKTNYTVQMKQKWTQ